MKLSFVAVVTASVVLFFNGVCGADTPTTTSTIDPRVSSSSVVEDFVLAGRKLLQAMTKEEANKVWHQLMVESEVPPSLRGSEKITTEMYENVTAAVTDRRQLVLRDSEKIRERRLETISLHEFDIIDAAGLKKILKIQEKYIKKEKRYNYVVEFFEGEGRYKDAARLKDVNAPGLGDIVGANCYVPDPEKNEFSKTMRMSYFHTHDAPHLKMKVLLLTFGDAEKCKEAQIAIVDALVTQKDSKCVPGGGYIREYQFSEELHRPLWCSHWCTRALKPIELDPSTDFTPSANAGMFWSTGKGRRQVRDNMGDAQQFAKDNGYLTLEQTVGGEILDEPKLFAKTYNDATGGMTVPFTLKSGKTKDIWVSNLNHVGYLLNCGSMEIALATGKKIATIEFDSKGVQKYPIHVYAEEANAISPFALLNNIPTWYNIELPSMIGAYLDTYSTLTKEKREFLDSEKVELTYHWKSGGEVVDKRDKDKSKPSFTAREVLDVYYEKKVAYPSYGEDKPIEETIWNSDKSMGKNGENCHPFGRYGKLACAPGLRCVNKNRLRVDVEDDYVCSYGESRGNNKEFDPCVYDSDCKSGFACDWTEKLNIDGSIKATKKGGVCQIFVDPPPGGKRDLCYAPAGRCTGCDVMKREFKAILEGCNCKTVHRKSA